MRLFQKICALLFLPIIIFSQTLDTLLIEADTIALRSIDFNEGWKYHTGDDSSWAEPNYDDSNWEIVDCRLNLEDSVKVDWKGIGWFRKTIQIDSGLVNENSALLISHIGASQIFMNGNLIHEFGVVSTDYKIEETFNPRRIPIIVNLDSSMVYKLAIRYSNWHAVKNNDWFKKWFDQIGFSIRITNSNRIIRAAVQNMGITFGANIGTSTVFLTLSLLYLLLFLFYRRQKENLYYSLFTFFLGIIFFISVIVQINSSSLSLDPIFEAINTFALAFAFVSYLGFLYSIFYSKMPRQFFIFFLTAVFITIFLFTELPSEIEDYSIIGLILIASLEGIRIIVLAIKRKEQNSWIIGTGVIIYAIFFLTIVVLSFFTTNINSIIGAIFFFFGLLSLPLSMSIYLARNIADTNRNLEKQLKTVKQLSEREIENQKRTAELELQAERDRIENERKSKELEDARKLQLSMLPKELPDDPGFDIAVSMNTATEVGGDYYDFHLSKDGILTTVIGDATGHGLMAGTMVTATKSLFNSFASNPDILSTLSQMAVALRKMNFRLLSMSFAIVKINNKKLKISSAGMPPVLIHRKGSGTIEEIFLRGMPLGSSATYNYELREVELFEGDTIFMYSDGFPELFNRNKEMFGYDRVKKEIQRIAQMDSETIINELNKVVDNWVDGKDIEDDITFVVMKTK